MTNIFIINQVPILKHLILSFETESNDELGELLSFSVFKNRCLKIQCLEVIKLDLSELEKLVQFVTSYEIQFLIFRCPIWKGVLPLLTHLRRLQIVYKEQLQEDPLPHHLQSLTYSSDKLGILQIPQRLEDIEFKEMNLQFLNRVAEISKVAKMKRVTFTNVKFSMMNYYWQDILKISDAQIIFNGIEVTLSLS